MFLVFILVVTPSTRSHYIITKQSVRIAKGDLNGDNGRSFCLLKPTKKTVFKALAVLLSICEQMNVDAARGEPTERSARRIPTVSYGNPE
jgi:hypothetical protein